MVSQPTHATNAMSHESTYVAFKGLVPSEFLLAMFVPKLAVEREQRLVSKASPAHRSQSSWPPECVCFSGIECWACDLNICLHERESLMPQLQLGNWYSLCDGGDLHLKTSGEYLSYLVNIYNRTRSLGGPPGPDF